MLLQQGADAQQTGAGSQQTGAGAQQTGAGAQQTTGAGLQQTTGAGVQQATGAGTQQLGAGLQQLWQADDWRPPRSFERQPASAMGAASTASPSASDSMESLFTKFLQV